MIGLARELNANLVLIDERKARRIARTIYRLHVIGSARVLVEAKRKGPDGAKILTDLLNN